MVPPAMQATSMVKMCGWFNYDVTSHKKLDPNQTDNFNISLLAVGWISCSPVYFTKVQRRFPCINRSSGFILILKGQDTLEATGID
jgi:hypothetical protein